MRMYCYLFVFLLLGMITMIPAPAWGEGAVIISEIAWMGTEASSNDEWIELFNSSDTVVSLNGWILKAQDGSPSIALTGPIAARGFFLLERTDDESVPGISADQIYAGALSNAGEVLVLTNDQGEVIDSVDASQGWVAGDNATKETMQRVNEEWASGPPSPKEIFVIAPRDDSFASSSPPLLQEAVVEPEREEIIPKVYPTSVSISEFLPDPEGSDTEGEWIELFNDSDRAADISGFFLDDKENGSRPYQIARGTTIEPQSFILFPRQETRIALNNDADEVRLLYPNGSVAALITYQDAKEGVTGAYNKETGEVVWTSNPTPGTQNNFSHTIVVVPATDEAGVSQTASVGALEDLPDISPEELGRANESLSASHAPQAFSMFDDFWIILFAFLIGAGSFFAYSRYVKKVSLVFLIILWTTLLFLSSPVATLAASFFIAPEFDVKERVTIEAQEVWTGQYARIFLEDNVSAPLEIISALGQEFDEHIYPQLVALFGDPWTPGIDGEERITILFTRLISGVGGYFNGDDELPQSVKPASNEREMVYLNANLITHRRMSAFLAHEFQHLISFNQKTRALGKEDEVWINEVRSEYAPTFLGYDSPFGNSNLQERYVSFLDDPSDNLVDWQNTRRDYGSVNMFAQYLNARFGSAFFQEEIRSGTVGRESVSETFQQFDATLTFPIFFAQWRLAHYVTHPDILEGKYSYKNEHLTFALEPEVTFDLTNPASPDITTSFGVPSFDGRAMRLLLEGNGALATIRVQDPSHELALIVLEELENGTIRESAYVFDTASRTLRFGKGTQNVLLLLSNVMEKPPTVVFAIDISVRASFAPLITSVEPVFLNPTREQNVFLITGENFDPGLTLFFNDAQESFIYQNENVLIVRVSSFEKTISIKAINPDGSEALLSWENPLASLSNRNTIISIPDGSLIRSFDDQRIWVVQNGFRRHIISPTIISFYQHLNVSHIQEASLASVEQLKSSSLIRFSGSPKVYEVLPNGTKRWIPTIEDFLARGFEWSAVFEVNIQELNFYPEAI